MLATMTDAVREYARAVGYDQPLVQWILSDYDTWEPNPFYCGPDQGHPEDGEILCLVYATFAQAAADAKNYAYGLDQTVRVEHYKDRCWVVWL